MSLDDSVADAQAKTVSACPLGPRMLLRNVQCAPRDDLGCTTPVITQLLVDE
jgi:hypothetical protein